MSEYIEQRDGGYWIKGTRVSLDSLVYPFRMGKSAESIAESFPSLKLVEVYGAITYYLANQTEIDRYLRQEAEAFETDRANAQTANAAIRRRLEDARKNLAQPHA